ncbi:uncharacterized protein [Clytia hemisphaerica]
MEINILEKELDEARAVFRQRLTDAAKTLKQLGKSIGNNIDKARPYFEMLSQSKKAQAECQNAAVTYEKAFQLHKGARDTIKIAEDKLMNNPGMFDAAWQEMLNNANLRIMEAEKEKYKNEQLHHESTLAYLELAKRASQLEKELRKSVNKARPYFEQRAFYLGYLEKQKEHVQDLESKYAKAKVQYSESLKNLEIISEEIHSKRNENKRGECVGAEADSSPPSAQLSRRRSTLRRQSEEKIKTALSRQRSQPTAGLWKYRHSLLLDLDVDFDIGREDGIDSQLRSPTQKKPLSPGAKSIDIGCVNMKYYDDFQVLDISPFLDKNKVGSPTKTSEKKLSYAIIPPIHELPSDVLQQDGHQQATSSTGVEANSDSNASPRKHSHAVVITMDDVIKHPHQTDGGRHSKADFVNHLSMVEEIVETPVDNGESKTLTSVETVNQDISNLKTTDSEITKVGLQAPFNESETLRSELDEDLGNMKITDSEIRDNVIDSKEAELGTIKDTSIES